jgi:hypothetical protein
MLAFVTVYSISATPQFHKICPGVKEPYLGFFHKFAQF